MRVTPEEMNRRKEHLLKTAVELMSDHGIDNVAQNDVAARAGVAHGNIQNYFGTYERMKKLVVEHACLHGDVKIVAQAAGHPKYGYLLAKKDLQAAIKYIKDY